jgi:hypothetical protein
MTKTSPSPEARLKSEKEAERLAGIIAEDHAALIEAQVKGLKKSLELAFELGEHLAEAKETCKIHGHGHWEKWFNNHSFKFSLRSAVRFMKLYGGKERIAQLLETNPPRVAEMTADGELSIRSAEALLKLTDEELATPKPPRTKAEGGKGEGSKGSNSKAAVQPAVQPTSSDLKDLLENVGPDELATALALADWDNEQLKELVKILSSRLKPVPADLTIPAGLQHPPPPQAEAAKVRRPDL